jgi:hypothetical protein
MLNEHDINFDKVNKQITEWLKDKDNDPHWKAITAEVKAYNKEIKRITSIIECDYDRYSDTIAEALDYYFREAYRLEDLKKWK